MAELTTRYQVFVSSTYEDLKIERAEAMQALLELDCMPAGMELFPAANEEQWQWIKRIIDESDYYVVIVGGRYGSINKKMKISYTEMEYRYANDCGKPILTFLHEDIETLPVSKSGVSESSRKQLSEFRKLCETRLCKYQSTPADLAAKLSRGLTQLIRHNPRAGWVRGDSVNKNAELELYRLKEENAKLRDRIRGMSQFSINEGDLANGDSKFEVNFCLSIEIAKTNKAQRQYWVASIDVWKSLSLTWNQIIYCALPILISTGSEDAIGRKLNSLATDVFSLDYADNNVERISGIVIDREDLEQIRMQLSALGYIEIAAENYSLKWIPTEKGKAVMASLGALRKGEGKARSLMTLLTASVPFEAESAKGELK